ncbi:hypothetical protein [Oharaeibacter diazotrophicus]|uniref:Uncharacterized protein n=1 Tax=Oharaeibacter diazotrophicus TaxID=1920512 RepID=A0A4R6RJI8_9HYPH|nr:hypothetical protein [Oharaeibacter diazotrophicus]TDP86630.1 hypothetical protein EDD54_0509 [Oharaeibacter diazotrophicus]BBE71428.1 hypothetical protein OHA_1_01002 [Pleomorphomonas sp. SM30]GLS78187.1 hypothetical protein GCM10007904_35240 [Oharaeibacter diazotrophicus]
MVLRVFQIPVAVAVGVLALVPSPAWAAAPVAACFSSCMKPYAPTSDDYFPFADHVKACRDRCDAATLDAMRADGSYAAYASCERAPLDKADFRALRAANASWQSQFNVFLWDVRNVFPDRVLTGITVRTQDMNLIDVDLEAVGVIPPGATGTFVIPDFFDGYPAVRYATKVTSVTACRIK